MKGRKYFITVAVLSVLLLAACKKDNLEEPGAQLTGRVIFNNEPIGVRSGGVSFEIWQRGYQVFSSIPLNIHQDGSFTAALFNGDYKLVRTKGVGPWADNSDTINISVNGSSSVDIPVDPYFVIKNAGFVKSGTNITATFTVQAVNTSKALELVRIYIGPNYILDQNNNAATAQKLAAAIDITQPVTLTVPVHSSIAAQNFIYARVGVKTAGVNELMYSTSQQVSLK
jgi:hypothetical protein